MRFSLFGLQPNANVVNKHGTIKTVNFPQPAAGQEQTLTVPSGKKWRVITVSPLLVTNATVANRQVHLAFRDDTAATIMRSQATVNHPASTTKIYNFSSGIPPYTPVDTNSFVNGPLPVGVFLIASWVITTITINLQAGDQFTQSMILVEEWSI